MGYREDAIGSFAKLLKPRISFLSETAGESSPSTKCSNLGVQPRSPMCEDDDLPGVEHEVFDVADELEKGLVDDAVLVQAARSPSMLEKGLRRCSILYKELTGAYHLLSESGDLLLVARYLPRESRFDIFTDARSSASEPSSANSTLEVSPSASMNEDASPGRERRRPAFVMAYNDNIDEWVLVQTRCDRCCHRPRRLRCEYVGKGQQVAKARHSNRKVHTVTVHHLSVYIPPLLHEGSGVWCPLWTGRDLCGTPAVRMPAGSSPTCRTPSSVSRENSRTFEPRIASGVPSCVEQRSCDEDSEAVEIQSILPKWDSEVESLVLNFKGRSVKADPRNFMMCKRGDQDCDILFQHAKMSNSMWCLDFRHPLSSVQAFGIALSSIRWD